MNINPWNGCDTNRQDRALSWLKWTELSNGLCFLIKLAYSDLIVRDCNYINKYTILRYLQWSKCLVISERVKQGICFLDIVEIDEFFLTLSKEY